MLDSLSDVLFFGINLIGFNNMFRCLSAKNAHTVILMVKTITYLVPDCFRSHSVKKKEANYGKMFL